MDGFIVIDKPEGVTSHDVVHSVRRILGQKKAGHTGTLDPFATGVLPVALGEGTKAIPFLDESIKEYLAVMHLGIITDTQDRTGKPIGEGDFCHITEEVIKETISCFVGTIKQVPPMFSALKRSGVPLYKLARQGKSIHREPREITIFSLNLEKVDLPRVFFRVCCSRGTYVRTLASDLGDKLGCGAHLSELRRIASGKFAVNKSISLENLVCLKDKGELEEKIISPRRSLSHLKEIVLSGAGADRLRFGVLPGMDGFERFADGDLLAGEKITLTFRGRLLAVAENISFPWSDGQKNLRLLRVFN